jgi:hypothetical protein
MIPFNLDNLRAEEARSLLPGSFFVDKHLGAQRLAVVLKPYREDRFHYMTLEGSNAFEIHEADARWTRSVIALNLDKARISLRFDPLSPPQSIEDEAQATGLLVFPQQGSAQILGVYDNLRDESFRSAVNLSDWEASRFDPPFTGYPEWRLSYLDDSGAWIDLAAKTADTVRNDK